MALDSSKVVNDVVDRLKKQGLFDKFRKECMADVDTKPAYQNLTHRVQAAVEQFLSSQTWHPDLNKNQLRESLRRHLNDLQMLSVGVDRVVDQVINQKVIQEFKPQIDRVMCEYLGVDYDNWIERQKARWQQPPPAPVPSFPAPTGNVPRLLDMHLHGPPAHGRFAPNADVNLPPPSVPLPGIPPGHLQVPPGNLPPSSLPSGVLQSRTIGAVNSVLQSSDISGVMTQLSHMRAAAHNVGAQPPPLPPFPDISMIASVPPPPLGHMNVSDTTTEPCIQFPPSASTSFNPGISLDYVSQSGYYSGYPDQASRPAEDTAGFPSVQTSILSAVVQSVTGRLGSAVSGFEQPRETKPTQMTKTARDREARAKKKQRKQAMEPLSVESFLGLSVSKPNAEDIFDNTKETAHDIKEEPQPIVVEGQKADDICTEEIGGKVDDASVSVIIIDDPALPGSETADSDMPVEVKEYHFEWDAMDHDQISDVSVSSVHTSDLSSFDEDAEQVPSPVTETDNYASDASPVKDSQVEKSQGESGTVEDELPKEKERKPKKLVALQSKYNDSDGEETRDQCKARMAREKQVRYLRRQQRRAELEQKRREKQSTASDNVSSAVVSVNTSETESLPTVGDVSESNVEENVRIRAVEQSPVKNPVQSDSGAVSEDSPMKSGSERGSKRRTKAQLKEELREKKVQEKQRQLRRQRTRNRKYLSEDFTSIFTEKKNLLASSGYIDDTKRNACNVEEEIVDPNDAPVVIIEDAENVVAECVEVGSSSSSDYSPRQRSRRNYDSDSDSRPGSPYSDISHSTVYSISSETSEASSGKLSHSEQSRSAAGQSSSQRETSRQSRSPAESRRLPYTRDSYRTESSRRLQSRDPQSPWRTRRESSYGAAESRSYGSAKNRPESKTDSRNYQRESPHVSKHHEDSPSTSGRHHDHGEQRGLSMYRSDSRDSGSRCGSASRGNVRQSQQRYSTAELYKPQTSHRHSPSANLLIENREWYDQCGLLGC